MWLFRYQLEQPGVSQCCRLECDIQFFHVLLHFAWPVFHHWWSHCHTAASTHFPEEQWRYFGKWITPLQSWSPCGPITQQYWTVTSRQWPDFIPHRKVHQHVLWCMDHHGCDKGGDGKFDFHIWLLITIVKENQEVFPKWVMSLEILCHFTISYTGQTLASVPCHSNCVILLSTTLVTPWISIVS